MLQDVSVPAPHAPDPNASNTKPASDRAPPGLVANDLACSGTGGLSGGAPPPSRSYAGDGDEENRPDENISSGGDSVASETGSSNGDRATPAPAQASLESVLDVRRCGGVAAEPRRRKRKRLDDVLENWEKYEGVHSVRAYEWKAEKEDLGEEVVEYNCAISSMQIASTAKEISPGGPRICRIADLPHFGICAGEVFLQPGQAVEQRLPLFFCFYRVLAGKVQAKIASGDGERRQTTVSKFTATRGTFWQVLGGNTCHIANSTVEPAAISFTRFHVSIARR